MNKKRQRVIVLIIVVAILLVGFGLLKNIIFNSNKQTDPNNDTKTIKVEKKLPDNISVKESQEAPQTKESTTTQKEEPVEVPKTETVQNSVENKAKEVNVSSIDLIGEQKITIEKGTKYVDQGAKALDSNGNDISNQINVDNSVDTSKSGEYTVTYSIGNYIVIRTVVVK